jgi:hypothetical protein
MMLPLCYKAAPARQDEIRGFAEEVIPVVRRQA